MSETSLEAIERLRATNLRQLIQVHRGPKRVAEIAGYSNASFLSQMTGPNATRRVSERTARKLEHLLGLDAGWLDRQHGPKSAPEFVQAGVPLPAEVRFDLADRHSRPISSAEERFDSVEIPRLLGTAATVSEITVSPAALSELLEFTRNYAPRERPTVFVSSLFRILECFASSRLPAADDGMMQVPRRVKPTRAPRPEPEQVRAARAAAGLTQTQAAETIGVSMRTWQDWESGQRQMHPSLMELFRIKTTGGEEESE